MASRSFAIARYEGRRACGPGAASEAKRAAWTNTTTAAISTPPQAPLRPTACSSRPRHGTTAPPHHRAPISTFPPASTPIPIAFPGLTQPLVGLAGPLRPLFVVASPPPPPRTPRTPRTQTLAGHIGTRPSSCPPLWLSIASPLSALWCLAAPDYSAGARKKSVIACKGRGCTCSPGAHGAPKSPHV
jgi:hypothetical protein